MTVIKESKTCKSLGLHTGCGNIGLIDLLSPSSVSTNFSLTESFDHDGLLPSPCVLTCWSSFHVASSSLCQLHGASSPPRELSRAASLCFAFYCALRQWRSGAYLRNYNTTSAALSVLDGNHPQHRCSEKQSSLPPKERTERTLKNIPTCLHHRLMPVLCLPSQPSPYRRSPSLMGDPSKTLQQWQTLTTKTRQNQDAPSHTAVAPNKSVTVTTMRSEMITVAHVNAKKSPHKITTVTDLHVSLFLSSHLSFSSHPHLSS